VCVVSITNGWGTHVLRRQGRSETSTPGRQAAGSVVWLWLAILTLDARHAAQSQTRFETITTITPPPSATAVPQRRRGLPPVADRTEPDNRQGVRATAAPVPPGDDASTSDDPSQSVSVDRDSRDDSATETPGLRSRLDGDFSADEAPSQPTDGDLSSLRTSVPVDGAATRPVDQRDEESRAAFEEPPAGYDARLFDIAVAPLLSERPRQLYRFEPYTAVGIRVGGFTLLPSLETSLVHDSNVFEAPSADADLAIEIVPTVRLVSNWSTHAVDLRASGVFSRFKEFETENARQYALEARGRLDVTRRLTVEGLVSRSLTQESQSGIDADNPALRGTNSAATERADIVTDVAALTINKRFNRLSLQLRGSVTSEDYDDTRGEGAVVIDNDARDEVQREGALRASWEFKPTLFAFAEVALNRRDFGSGRDDAASANSRGERYRAGVSFGNADQYLRGEISVGFGTQRPVNGVGADLSGLLLDANLAWRVSGLTSLLFTARTDLDDSTDVGSGSVTRTLGVEARHAFRRHLIGNTGVSYAWQDFEGTSLSEDQLTAIAGLEYFINRDVTLFGRYTYTRFNDTADSGDYVDNEIRIGLRMTR